MPRHVVIKMTKIDKKRILKQQGKYKGTPTSLSTETWQVKWEWYNILKVMKRKEKEKKKPATKNTLSSKATIQV